jgi:hypothetical protein
LTNPDGQVFPCCYLSNVYYYSKRFEELGKWDELFPGHKLEMDQHLLVEYEKRKKENNIFETPIDEIIKGEWFSKILPESWENDETVHVQCKRMCNVDTNQ